MKFYVLTSIVLIVLAYALPYTILSDANGPELFLYWLTLTMLQFIISLKYLKKPIGEEK